MSGRTEIKTIQGFNGLNREIAVAGARDDSIEDVGEFYAAIDRKSLSHRISGGRPYVYTTMEVYDAEHGIRGAGGLGVLAADTRRVAEMLDSPFVMLTPFYRLERHQRMDNLIPEDYATPKEPREFGYEKVGETNVQIADSHAATLEIFEKVLGSTRFLTMTEPNFGQLYSGESSSDHRLYQLVSLGFGGYAALKMRGLRPAVIQLNETSTIFAAVARLDELCRNGMNLYEAIVYVRKHTLYTNHTLVQAAEASFSLAQFQRFVFPNIESPALKYFIGSLFGDDTLRLSDLTIELAEAKNCVSKLHAKVIDFRDLSGEKVDFRAITNGIDLRTWLDPAILKFFREKDIVNRFDMPGEQFRDILSKLTAMDIGFLRAMKRSGRSRLNQVLSNRKDQFGEKVQIPSDALLFNFKRRFVSYKRPWMAFEDVAKLKQILIDHNAHYIMSGMMPGGVGPGDKTYDRLQQMLGTITNDPVLRERVHYITDYDEELAAAMAVGSDISINVPEVGWEACGTSFMKDIANLTILVSTNDGGVADVEPPAIHLVSGDTYEEEVASLYAQMNIAAGKVQDKDIWAATVAEQLSAYLPTISGTRMLRDYLRFLFKTD
jgi:alpha-glucan phosphorylase-like protein